LAATCDDFELIFVDDGSTDRTFELLAEIADRDPRVTVVRLRRNYGKTEALVAGFDHATGDCIIVMDGDLQHDPHEIPLFIQKIEEGYDIVCGCRVARPGDSFITKRIPSKIGNWLMSRLTGVPLHDFVSGFKAYRANLIHQIPLYGELQRFIPALAAAYGARICEIPIHIAERRHGESHYGFGRAVPFLFDLVTIPFLVRYVSRPMHFFGRIGFLALATGGAVAFWLLIRMLTGVNVLHEHTPLMFFTAVLLIAGTQMLCLGLLGEMQVRYQHQKGRGLRESEVLRVTKRTRRDPS
jgi:glycosyltransferase involved in cell wall biosynthesis